MSDCPHCRDFAHEANALHQEIAGLNAEVLKQVREKAALRGQLTKQRKAEDISKHVMAVLRMWNALCCSHRASIAPSGKNADNVRTAFLHYTNPDHTVAQRRHTLYDCVKGAALRPFDAGYGKRTANPAGAVRRVTTAHIFASEDRIESFAGYYRMVQAQPLEWVDKVWMAASDVSTHWQFMYFELERRCRETGTFPATWRGRPLDPVTGLYADDPAPVACAHMFLDEAPPAAVPETESSPRLFVVPDPESEAA